MLNGILPLYKPRGMTSFDCVAKIRRLYQTRKVGHSGTLDPNVDGVLPICIGNATKVVQFLVASGKEYQGSITLGFATTTEDLDGEEWKPIDRRGKYYISNRGRVKSFQGKRTRLLKPYSNQRGYLRVDIRDGHRRTYLVHQLVALSFIPNDNPIEKDTVDHIDMDKTNNRVENLRWLSRADNARAYQKQRKEVSADE